MDQDETDDRQVQIERDLPQPARSRAQERVRGVPAEEAGTEAERRIISGCTAGSRRAAWPRPDRTRTRRQQSADRRPEPSGFPGDARCVTLPGSRNPSWYGAAAN